MNNALRIIVMIVVIVAVFAGVSTYAASSPTCEGRTGYCTNLSASVFAAGNRAEVADIKLGDYIEKIYIYLLGLVGISALLMFIVGGIMYMTARDNAAQVGTAKNYLWNAILGLVLALVSWLLLNTINPDLVKKLAIDLPNLTAPEEKNKIVGDLCRNLFSRELQKYYNQNDALKNPVDQCVTDLTKPGKYQKTGKACSSDSDCIEGDIYGNCVYPGTQKTGEQVCASFTYIDGLNAGKTTSTNAPKTYFQNPTR